MKKKFILSAVCSLCLSLLLLGCTPGEVPVEGLKMDKSAIMLSEGESKQLNVIFTPEDASDKTLTWESEDEEVATVDNGKVKALKEGQTKVTARTVNGDFQASCRVSVVPRYELELKLGEWETDRTDPLKWDVANGWVTVGTKPEPNNDWYSWQGKKASCEMQPTTSWMVSTRLDLTEELLGRDGVRTSMWLNVTDGSGKSLDWAILQYGRRDAEQLKGWQYWNSTASGSWVDIEGVEPTAGIHDLAIAFDEGEVGLWIDAQKVASYELEPVSAVREVLFNSYSFGESYEARWQLPKVAYNKTFAEGTLFASEEAGLRDALEKIGEGKTLILAEGTYELSSQIHLDKNITLEGMGEVVLKPGSEPWVSDTGAKGPASVVLITDAEVTLRNLTITGAKTLEMSPSGTDFGHGLNAVNAKVTLEKVTLTDNEACGIVANSSDVILKNVRTSGNGTAGLNADSQATPDRQTTVTVDESTVFEETVQIYSDDSAKVTVTAEGYTSSDYEGKTVWTKTSSEALRDPVQSKRAR